MTSLEQYLKPPTKSQEEEKELYKEEGENGEEENEYIQNEENGNESIENDENIQNNEDEQNSKNKNLLNNNPIFDDDNNGIVQGINLIGNIGDKNININKEENKFIYENKKNLNIENEKNNNENDYMNKYFLNINKNTNSNNDLNSPEQLMKEILFKINRIKENRAKSSNKINKQNIDKDMRLGFEKTKIKNNNKNEYIGKLNINNQVFQNNPKMKELVNILKDYNKDKNENDNDKIQLNFYNTDQINIIKPEIIFNNMSNLKNKNIDCYNKNNEIKYYVSAIDGKAIVNGQRLDVKNEFQLINDNLKNKNVLFDFVDDNFMEKTNKFKNDQKMWNTGKNLDFKLNTFNFFKKNENLLKTIRETDNRKEFKKITKNNFLSKDFYNEELNKINNSLFNIENNMNKLKK